MSPSVRYKEFVFRRPFGVELEVNEQVDRNSMGEIVQRMDPNREVVVTHGWAQTGGEEYGPTADVWNVKTDSTCATLFVPGHYGHEVASPKLSSAKDIVTLGKVTAALKDAGCKVNKRCGVHVHADISDFTKEQVGVLLARWCKVEGIIGQALPRHRRENQYAMMMRKKHKCVDGNQVYSGESLYNAMEPTSLETHHNLEKRVAINLIGYALGIRKPNYKRKTAELRLPESNLNREDVENWTRFYVQFVNESATKPMGDLKPVGLREALVIMGLAGGDEFLLLDEHLFATKIWFLKRLLKYATDKHVFAEAVNVLNSILDPLERYRISCESVE